MAGYKMPPRGSGPTSRNRYKKLHFSTPLLTSSLPSRRRISPRESVCRPARDHEDRLRPVVRRGGLRCRPGCPGAGAAENLPEADTRRRSPRLPGHVLRVDQMRDHRADQVVGAGAVLRPFDLRARRRQLRPSVRASGGLRPAAQGQPQVQALRQD